MSVKEIFLVVVLVSVFIVASYKTKRLNPDKKPKVWPGYLRILVIVSCLGLLSLVWLYAPDSPVYLKILVSVYAILYIYRALKGWRFKSKDYISPTPSQFPD